MSQLQPSIFPLRAVRSYRFAWHDKNSFGWYEPSNREEIQFVITAEARITRAANVVERFPLTSAGWDDAWERLTNSYPDLAVAVEQAAQRASQQREPSSEGGSAKDDPVIAFESVEFQKPRSGGRARAGLWFNAVYFGAIGVWAVAGSWHRHPILGLLAGFVYLEFALAFVRGSTFTGGVVYEQALAARIARPLVGLCARAGCPLPRVVIRDDSTRAACVRRGRNGSTSLVLAKPFMDLVDDRELRAIMAHEVAHIARNDLVSARRLARITVAIVSLVVLLLIVTTRHRGVILPIYVAAFIAASVLLSAGMSVFNRRLEWRADWDGASLDGDPEHLARALAHAHAFSEDARKRVYGPLPWRWILSPLSWRRPSHPPMAQRIARLEQAAVLQADGSANATAEPFSPTPEQTLE